MFIPGLTRQKAIAQSVALKLREQRGQTSPTGITCPACHRPAMLCPCPVVTGLSARIVERPGVTQPDGKPDTDRA